jgi:hypothetical protein
MERTIRLNFDVSLVYGPRTWRAPIVAVMLLCAVGELNSESVTLSTYYPAPSGVYTNMITTGNTFLARDGGAATKVGVGTTAPGAKMAVAGSMSVGGPYSATVPPANSLIVSGRIGVGVTAPTQALEVSGSLRISSVGCAVADVTQGGVCNGAQYATFTPGFYIEGWSYQNRGGAVVAQSATTTTNQVLGLHPGTQMAGYPKDVDWMTLRKDDSQTRIWCCPR